MSKIFAIPLSLLVLTSGGASAGGEPVPAPTGFVSLSIAEQTYVGRYAAADKSLSVDIDGLSYRGNYASVSEDTAAAASGAMTGTWGRAFLFASSAKTLRCQLDAGFPAVSGQCQDADGRQFKLKAGTEPFTLTLTLTVAKP